MSVQIPDVLDDSKSPVLDVIVRAGFRALLIVPLLGARSTVGALVVRRKQPGDFAKHTVDLLQTFAAQSVLAIRMHVCLKMSNPVHENWRSRWGIFGPRRIAWSRLRSSPHSGN